MEENESRKMYIRELLIDDLDRSDYYSTDTIDEKLQTYFQLKLKIKHNNLLKKHLENRIAFYEQELKNKVNLFKSGTSWKDLTTKMKEAYKNPIQPPGTLNNNISIPGMSGMSGMYGMDQNNQTNMNMYNNSAYGYDHNAAMMGQQGMAMGQPGQIFGGYGGYDSYGYGQQPYDQYGQQQGFNMPGQQTFKKMVNNATASDYGKYLENTKRISEIEAEITQNIKLTDSTNEDDNNKKNQALKKEIEKLEKKNEQILKNLKKELPETEILKQLNKDKRKLKIKPKEIIEYEKLELFFKDILNYDTRPLDECNTNIFDCFNKIYKQAKAFIERENAKYNIIISKYIDLIEKSIYDPVEDKDKFVKYMKYLTKKILKGKNIIIENTLNPEDYKDINKLLLNDNKLFPDNLDFNRIDKDTFTHIPSKKFLMITPEQAKTITSEQWKSLDFDKFSNLSSDVLAMLPASKIQQIVNQLLDPNNNTNKQQALQYLANTPSIFDKLTPEQQAQVYNHDPHATTENMRPSQLSDMKLNDIINNQEFKPDDILELLKKSRKSLNKEELEAILKKDLDGTTQQIKIQLFQNIRYNPEVLNEIDYNEDIINENLEYFINYNVKNQIALLSSEKIKEILKKIDSINCDYINKIQSYVLSELDDINEKYLKCINNDNINELNNIVLNNKCNEILNNEQIFNYLNEKKINELIQFDNNSNYINADNINKFIILLIKYDKIKYIIPENIVVIYNKLINSSDSQDTSPQTLQDISQSSEISLVPLSLGGADNIEILKIFLNILNGNQLTYLIKKKYGLQPQLESNLSEASIPNLSSTSSGLLSPLISDTVSTNSSLNILFDDVKKILNNLNFNNKFFIILKLKTEGKDTDDAKYNYKIIDNNLVEYIINNIKNSTDYINILNYRYFENGKNISILSQNTFWKILRRLNDDNNKIAFYDNFVKKKYIKDDNIIRLFVKNIINESDSIKSQIFNNNNIKNFFINNIKLLDNFLLRSKAIELLIQNNIDIGDITDNNLKQAYLKQQESLKIDDEFNTFYSNEEKYKYNFIYVYDDKNYIFNDNNNIPEPKEISDSDMKSLLIDKKKYIKKLYTTIQNQNSIKNIDMIIDIKLKLRYMDIISKLNDLIHAKQLNNPDYILNKYFIKDTLQFDQSGGEGEELKDKSDKNILANIDARNEVYIDKIEKWKDLYDDLFEKLKNEINKLDKITTEYNIKIEKINDSIKTFNNEGIEKELKIYIAEDKHIDLESKLSKLKASKPEIKTNDLDIIIEKIIALNNEIIKAFKEDKDLKKILSSSDFNNLIDYIKGNNGLQKNLDKIKNMFEKFKLDTSKYEEFENIKRKILENLERLNRYNGKNEADFNQYFNKIKTEYKKFNDLTDFNKYDINDLKNLIIDDEILLKSIKHIKEFLEKIQKKIKKRNTTSISRVVATGDGTDFTSPSMYSKLWNKYLEDVNDEDKLLEETQENLYNKIQLNNLDPSKALKLTKDDKIIFIIIIVILRQIALAITESLIDNGVITNILQALTCYVIVYICIIVIITIIINFDDYKLRIMFNFFNMHINSNGLFVHNFLVIGLIYILYYLSQIMDQGTPNTKTVIITDIEKLKLNYKLELITMAVFVFVAVADYFK
jgi:hypothetical protein